MRAHASIPWTFAVALGCAGPTAPTIGTSPDDLDRTPAADLDAPPEPCEGLPTEMRVLGTIFSPLGHPVGGVEVHGEGAAAPVLTDAVGRYQLMLPGPGAVSLGGRWSWPERSCVGVPPKFTVLGPEGAQIRMNMRDIHLVTAPQCVHDVNWGDDAARWLIAETPRGWERLGHLQPGAVALPCDLDRLVVVGTSDAGVWDAPATSGTWAVPLQPAPTRAIRLQDASGNPLEGVADTPWGAIPTDAKGALDLAWPDAAAPLFARAPGHVPPAMPATDARKRRGSRSAGRPFLAATTARAAPSATALPTPRRSSTEADSPSGSRAPRTSLGSITAASRVRST